MKKKKLLIYTILIIFLILIFVFSLSIGKYDISIFDIKNIIFCNTVNEMQKKVFWTLRFPRTFMTILAGIGLGLVGYIYQIIFKNPLASPDIVGIAGGANLGAAVAIVLFSNGMFSIAIGSFIGGLLAVVFVLLVVRLTGHYKTSTYVLSGIIINSLTKVCIMTLKYFADPESELSSMEYWEMGTFGNVTFSKFSVVIKLFLISFVGLIILRRQIEMLELDENECKSLGVNVIKIRTAILVLSTLLVSSIISITGLIAFVGLIAPHLAIIIYKKRNFETMILSLYIGAIIVLVSDTLSRSIYSSELPVSIFTTIVGVPFICYFMYKKKRIS